MALLVKLDALEVDAVTPRAWACNVACAQRHRVHRSSSGEL